MNYKVVYYQGETIDLKTKMKCAIASITDSALEIVGSDAITIPFAGIDQVELFRLYGLGRMIKVNHDGRTLFMTVFRLNLSGIFVIVNFWRTGELLKRLQSCIPSCSTEENIDSLELEFKKLERLLYK
jgi:hypothetical protein